MTECATVTLYGSPLDGEEIDVDVLDNDPWVPTISDTGCTYPGGRSVYAPAPDGRWTWQRDLPADGLTCAASAVPPPWCC
ncbi:hypothetical protein [Streptomyces sp. NRRL S-350]|uniref:hypothetical protein n=1 Tax=Streptomyces sp. NRRL S-350 TaxID=1463902 RepID=UPI00099D9214|nr:hypothetical protein [Streptomyces sp. NRRL S-350]